MPASEHDFPPPGPVFVLEAETVTYADLLLVASLTGEWTQFERGTAAAVVYSETMVLDNVDLRNEAETFRRTRQLEAGDDLRNWLAARDISLEEWTAALVRGIARRRSGSGPNVETEGDSLPALSHDVLHVDAFCTRLWESLAAQASDWLGAFCLRGEASASPVLKRVDEIGCWRAAYLELIGRAVDTAAVAAVVREHELEWTTFDVEVVTVNSESAAREVVLCARDDGSGSREIALQAHARYASERVCAEILEPSVAASLQTTAIGGIVGPVARNDGWSVMWLRSRHRPSRTDPETRRRATQHIVRELLDRRLAANLRWLGPR